MGEKKKEVVKSKSGFKLVIIFLILIILIALGAATFWMFFLNKKGETQVLPASVNGTVSTNKTVNFKTTDGGRVIVMPNKQVVILSTIKYDLGEFVVNLSDEGGKKFLKAKLAVGFESKKLTTELEENKMVVRDIVISVLKSKKTVDYLTEKGVDDIKNEIIKRLNPYFEKGQISNVYIYEQITQ